MEKEFKKLEKSALGCMYTATLVTSIGVLGILSGVVFYFGLTRYKLVVGIYIGIMIITLLNIIISPYFRYNRYRYSLDDEAMEIIEGYIFVSHNIVPIERIQNIELAQGPIDRIFGVAKMTITTGGSDVTARFMPKQVADKMADKLKKNINDIVVEDREEKEDGEN